MCILYMRATYGVHSSLRGKPFDVVGGIPTDRQTDNLVERHTAHDTAAHAAKSTSCVLTAVVTRGRGARRLKSADGLACGAVRRWAKRPAGQLLRRHRRHLGLTSALPSACRLTERRSRLRRTFTSHTVHARYMSLAEASRSR